MSRAVRSSGTPRKQWLAAFALLFVAALLPGTAASAKGAATKPSPEAARALSIYQKATRTKALVRPITSRKVGRPARKFGRPKQPPAVKALAPVRTGTVRPLTAQPQVQDQDGPVQSPPAVYVVYWGWTSDPSGEQPYLGNFLSSVGGTNWLATVLQYDGGGSPANVLAGTWSDSTAVPTSPTDAQIQAEATSAATHFGLSASPNTDILVATPTGHSESGLGTSYCASNGVTSSKQAYIYLPYVTDGGTNCGENRVNSGSAGTLDGVGIVTSAELGEVVTNPQNNGWYDSVGNDIAMKCAWNGLGDVTTSKGTFAAQPLWSNTSAACALGTTPATASPALSRFNAGTDAGAGNLTLLSLFDLKGSGGFVWAEYGTTTSYGTQVGYQPLASGTTQLGLDVTGLVPGTVYHYRIGVSDTDGTVYSADQTYIALDEGTPSGTAVAVQSTGTGNETITGRAIFNISPLTGTTETSPDTYGDYYVSYWPVGGSVTNTPTQSQQGLFSFAGIYWDSPNPVYIINLNGLTPGTTYDYQVTVGTHGGSWESPVQSFTPASSIPAGPPILGDAMIDTVGPQIVADTSVDLQGAPSTNLTLYYGTTPSYGATVVQNNLRPYQGATSIYNSQDLTGLSSGTTYHYTFLANDNYGRSGMGDATFVTP